MGVKHRARDGQTELFDGFAVSKYNAAFQGKYEVDEINSENITYDDHVCFVVLAKAGEVRIKPDKDDDLVRTNVFNPIRVVQISPDLAERALQVHSQGTGTPQLPLSRDAMVDQLSGAVAGPDDDDDEEENDDEETDDDWEDPAPPPAAPQVKVADPALRDFLYNDKS